MPCIRNESIYVFADYHQFYVQDGAANPPAPEDWTDADIAHRAKAAANVLVVCPVRNMTVPVKVELHDVTPQLQSATADHLVECSLALPSGHLQVHECTGGAVLNWQVEPGQYEVAVLYSCLGSVSTDGLDGDDHYQVLLWRGADRPLRVVQEWSEQ
jgi:hypothetical protein